MVDRAMVVRVTYGILVLTGASIRQRTGQMQYEDRDIDKFHFCSDRRGTESAVE
jgi:hypothetical protein